MKYLTQAQAAAFIGITPSNLYRGEYLGDKIKPVIHNRKKKFLRVDVERLKAQRDQIKAKRKAPQSGYMKYKEAMEEKQRIKTMENFLSLYKIEQASDRWFVYLRNQLVCECSTLEGAKEYILLQRGKERAPRHLF